MHSEVNQLIQHIKMQDQDGQNNNTILMISQKFYQFLDMRVADSRIFLQICSKGTISNMKFTELNKEIALCTCHICTTIYERPSNALEE